MRRLIRESQPTRKHEWNNGHEPDSVQRVGCKTRTNGDTPAEHEGREERTLESTNEDDRLCEMIG